MSRRLPFAGEYGTPGMSRSLMRIQFLNALAALVPDVVVELRDEVLPVYQSGGEGEAVLEGWARKYHLTDDWLLDQARLQLGFWRTNEIHAYPRVPWPPESPRWEGPVRLGWSSFHTPELAWWPPSGADGPSTLSFEWNPATKSKREARAEMIAALDQYLDDTEAAYHEAPGWRQASTYRELEQALAWLVQYQVVRMSWPEIAAGAVRELSNGRQVEVAVDGVSRRVKELAGVIDILLVPVRPPGRPANSPTVNTRDHSATRRRPRK